MFGFSYLFHIQAVDFKLVHAFQGGGGKSVDDN